MKASTLLLGLNPAWQKIIRLSSFQEGEVNRAYACEQYASGKGINCARVLQKLGGEAELWHWSGGDTGDWLNKELQDATRKNDKLIVQNFPIKYRTRVCSTIINDEGSVTEIIEPSPKISIEEQNTLERALNHKSKDFKRLAICGSFPDGVDDVLWNSIQTYKGEIYLDAWKGVDTLLESDKVALLKLNEWELRSLAGITDNVDLNITAKLVIQKYKLGALVVTRGEKEILLFAGSDRLRARVQREAKVLNVIGAGDSFLAGWIYAAQNGADLQECLRSGVAASHARVEVLRPWDFSIDSYKNWLQEVQIESF
jgi:1-phosphofructokinase